MSKLGQFAAACAAVVCAFGVAAANNPFAGYAHKAKITFGGYAGESTLTNFPALVRLAEDMGGFSYADCAQANGGDVRFTLGDGLELASECVKWDRAGESQFWVRVPELTQNTVVYMCWGNADAAKRDQRLRVWDREYTSVWTMEDSKLGLADKSIYGNFGNATSDSTRQPGMVGVARQFVSANSDFARAGYGMNASYDTPSTTYECWYKLAGYCSSSHTLMAIAPQNAADNRPDSTLFRDLRLKKNGWPEFCMNGQSFTGGEGIEEKVDLETWHHVLASYDGATKTCNLYVDGVRIGGGAYSKTETVADRRMRFQLGYGYYPTLKDYYFDGSMDEVRVSRVARSADYAAAVYKNVADNGAFLTIEEQAEEIPSVDPLPKRKFTFTLAAEAGGSVSPSGTVEVEEGSYLEVTATATDDTKAFYAWGGNCPTTQVFSAKIRLPADCNRTVTARFGTAYFVSKDEGASDENNGRSLDTAKATIGGALAQIESDVTAVAGVVPAVVLVGKGTYDLTKAHANNGAPEYVVARDIAVRSTDGKGKAVIDFKNETGNCGAFHLKSLGSVVDGFKFIRIRERGAYSGIHRVAKIEAGHLLDCEAEVSTLASSDDYYVVLTKGWMCGCLFVGPGSASKATDRYRSRITVGSEALVDTCVFRDFSLGVPLVSLQGTIRNSQFSNLSASNATSGNGGAVSCGVADWNATREFHIAAIHNCTFVNCSAAVKGGALYSGGTKMYPCAVNCAFLGNSASTAALGPDAWGVNLYNCLAVSADGENGNIVGGPSYNSEKPDEYEPIGTSLTRDGGVALDWTLQAGMTDLVGTNRFEELAVDIGCREFPQPVHEKLAVTAKLDVSSGTDALVVSFSAVVTGDKAGLAYAWDFGDGETSTEASPTHAYVKPGYYTVTLTVENEAGETANYTGADAVKVRSSICYVRAEGASTPAEPYATPETAANNIGDALGMGPKTIDVGEGSIPLGKTIRLNYGVCVVGAGPDKTMLTAGGCDMGASNFYVEHEAAVLTGVCVDNPWCNWGTMMSLSDGVISNCVFRKCGSNYTGTMFMLGGRLVDCRFDQCWSPHAGIGGVLVTGSDAVIERCVFSGLSGMSSGVAIRVQNTTSPGPTIRNCLLEGSKSTRVNVTAAVYCESPAVIENCTIVGNKMEYGAKAGGLYLAANDVEVRNTIVWGNTVHATNIVEGIDGTVVTNIGWNAVDVAVAADKSVVFSHSCAPELADVATCLAEDPKYNAGRKSKLPYYAILGSSPCKNTGVKLDWMTDEATDIIGNPRVFGGMPDIGCYESLSSGLTLIVR